MTCQRKSEGKIADFETLIPCIFLCSSQTCTHFCKDLVIEYCLYLVKDSILGHNNRVTPEKSKHFLAAGDAQKTFVELFYLKNNFAVYKHLANQRSTSEKY